MKCLLGLMGLIGITVIAIGAVVIMAIDWTKITGISKNRFTWWRKK